ncbi:MULTISPECIES: hypothetical protein [unclassified Mucilaginibacter]|uniref:hypothetical protein n=1 Tax=unclassified Mucilaginibacter TaxID=2617802 RepID=UPI002AC90560|nr:MULTISPECIES: hypothetical protein [unclassified Mucilaginibacter]MEB0248788.1 hypothetical protein [Mucilaginibacter sp. 5B2]MEB0262748.1 hypothetical protein [Mucilaginibacter sp. 10I4]MEB0279520.1 hypothetical protein [Mucilaginibacter sp. 10B2]MEB0302555.1 hypothetical protein [Mucilaginibacter sp. 5C4]WPX22612.1 hypothetical protein RHM67_15125 [Mucilaginibacter sp. 5C4]
MISEFMGFYGHSVYGLIIYKHLAIIPFIMGVFCLAYYYAYWQPRHPNEVETL